MNSQIILAHGENIPFSVLLLGFVFYFVLFPACIWLLFGDPHGRWFSWIAAIVAVIGAGGMVVILANSPRIDFTSMLVCLFPLGCGVVALIKARRARRHRKP